MAKTDKADRPKPGLQPRLPRGFQDQDTGTLRATRAMLETIRSVFERYGFDPVETPAIEYTEALGKFLPDQDRPNEGVFSFQDDDEQWLSLRYDLTAPLARYVAENFERLPKPYRSYRTGYVFRNEKPGPGRFRQFMQFDADTVGSASVAADAEICMMAADVMDALGLQGQYVVKVNNRKVLDGLMETLGLAGDENAGKRLTVLRAIDKFDRLGRDGVIQLLGPGRKDESGDVTKGAGLSEDQINQVMGITAGVTHGEPLAQAPTGRDLSDMEQRSIGDVPHYFDNRLTIEALYGAVGDNALAREGVRELSEIAELAESAGYGTKRIVVDTSVVRGLEYYTGPVYEVELTFETFNEKGEKARFGSVAGGGRYDGLVGRFRPEDTPATGFSIGVSRLLAALSALDRVDTAADLGPVVVLVDKNEVSVPNAQKMVSDLRKAGIRAEMYLGASRNFGPQMKYADRRRSPCVIIQGDNERERDVVQVKDLIEGARLSQQIESRDEWREARPAQVEVAVDKLVDTVREIVARHH